MRARLIAPIVVVIASACASAGSSRGGVVSWKPGRYGLEGYLSVRQDSETEVRTERIRVMAEIRVEKGERRVLRSSEGFCSRRQVGRGTDGRTETFKCGESLLMIWPEAGTGIAGSLRKPVTEWRQMRGRCEAPSPEGRCLRYSTIVGARRTSATAALRATRLDDGDPWR